jgi:hypothetical protein
MPKGPPGNETHLLTAATVITILTAACMHAGHACMRLAGLQNIPTGLQAHKLTHMPA